MRGKWRFFRPEAGRESGPHPVVYVALFLACIAVGNWTAARFGSVSIWPANGVLLAAFLQLHKRRAITVLASCFALNLLCNWLRHDTPHMLVLNAVLNMGEALMAGVLARRVCGAALDMRRPKRLAMFAFFAVLPTVALSAVICIAARPTPWDQVAVSLQNYTSVEALGILISTPALLLLARRHRFADEAKPLWEKAALMGLLAVVTAVVFAQAAAPVMFLVFLPLLLIAYRLSPPWAAAGVFVVAIIAGGLTLTGHGPATLSTLGPAHWPNPQELKFLRMAAVFHLFMGAVVGMTLPASTVLTERRRLEARLRARTEAAVKARALAEQAAEAKSRFLSMMSHEMRTPLNGVSGFAELLAERPGLDGEAARQVEQIRRSSEGLLLLVDDILDFSRGGEDLNPAPFSVAEVVGEAAARARIDAEAKGLSVSVAGDLDPGARHLGDARRVRQVLSHLLSNAVKFTAEGQVELTLTLWGDAVDLTVADTGPGLAAETLPTLFQPFAQGDASIRREHEGAGMGLALSKRLVELMGGEISGRNGPGGGAVFRVSLPLERLADVAAPAIAEPADQASIQPRAPRILVVDDHPMNREVAALMLGAAGCEVSVACDGAEAVDAVRDGGFDLVFMDVRMPRMDGLEATRAIRGLAGPSAATPIVAMTADAMPEDVARCRDAGMNDHLAKPVNRGALMGVLTRFLDEAASDGDDRVAAA